MCAKYEGRIKRIGLNPLMDTRNKYGVMIKSRPRLAPWDLTLRAVMGKLGSFHQILSETTTYYCELVNPTYL